MKRWKIPILYVVLLGLVAAGYFAYAVRQYVSVTIPNAYGVWWVADMVIEHMESNDGAWPKNWKDLEDDYETCVKRSGKHWTFDELQSRVVVDWNADPIQLVQTKPDQGSRPFHVIRVRDGTNVYWGSHEPNQKILDYLLSRQAASRMPAKTPPTNSP